MNVRRGSLFAQRQQAWVKLIHDPLFVHRLKARMQGRKLHRHTARLFRRDRLVLLGGHGINRQLIGFQVAGSIICGARALAQHVETEMGRFAGFDHALAALERFFHCASKDELFAHDPHGLHHGCADDGLATFADQS